MRNLLWLALAASARGLTVPAATREAVGGDGDLELVVGGTARRHHGVVETTPWRGVASFHLHLLFFPTMDSTTTTTYYLHLPLFPTMDSTTTTTYTYQVPARDAARARKGAPD